MGKWKVGNECYRGLLFMLTLPRNEQFSYYLPLLPSRKLLVQAQPRSSLSSFLSHPSATPPITLTVQIDGSPRRRINRLRDIIRGAPNRGVKIHIGRIVIPDVAAPAGDDAAAAAEVVQEAGAAAASVIA